MSREFVALIRTRPEIPHLLELVELPHGLQMGTRAGAIELFDENGHMLVAIRDPFLVQVPGESERLLGIATATPAWWVEIQAAATNSLAIEIAERCARTAADLYGGTVWPPADQ
ncbi:hypothetical protein ACGFNU_17795 [Spirillospora sp. NPDC048911]|uniref:hypothetical protein n=1 Tax=Spirillospora sp. NPDC048911 TaxID=3364527 RepID=UPI003710DBBB